MSFPPDGLSSSARAGTPYIYLQTKIDQSKGSRISCIARLLFKLGYGQSSNSFAVPAYPATLILNFFWVRLLDGCCRSEAFQVTARTTAEPPQNHRVATRQEPLVRTTFQKQRTSDVNTVDHSFLEAKKNKNYPDRESNSGLSHFFERSYE